MTTVAIVGSGISGLSTAVSLAEKGIRSVVLSPFPSERSQSVMAAGGINAVDEHDPLDSIEAHIEDTLSGGRYLAGYDAVKGLCSAAPGIIAQLERAGTVFTRNAQGGIDRRAFGGQRYKRTCYSGTATGKQIVSALVMACRRYEALGLIERRQWSDFHSALIKDGHCYGILVFDESTRELYPLYADAVVMAAGGQNALFGKTTGSTVCDGYAAGRLFMQGADLKNLEFIQYHPTTLETPQKKMLVSEAARGEGGRLFYEKAGRRIYFMEERYGDKGNLMPRDVISREMAGISEQVYLDVSFLGKDIIEHRLPEVQELCRKYRGIDITEEPIPVTPSVHFFMGGLAVDLNHETNIRELFAVGECASIYHGANRLGGNSLLAALYSGHTAAEAIAGRSYTGTHPDLTAYVSSEQEKLSQSFASESRFPVMYIRDLLAEHMQKQLGIVREKETLLDGIRDIEFYLDSVDRIHYDSSVLAYFNYSLKGLLVLAKATLLCAEARRESRGAHNRSDYPEEDPQMNCATIISYEDGAYRIHYDREGRYEH
ncbi:MAG: FAD-binding protein [Solobacterium sp.]|nr:FAD-binding protein [Solobacterium sp.]